MTPLAYIVLFGWPIVTIMLFRSLPLREALAWAIVLGFLFVPALPRFNFPVIPTINKEFMIVISAGLLCLIMLKVLRRPSRAISRLKATPVPRDLLEFNVKRGQVFYYGLLILLFTSPFLTAMQNSDGYSIGPRFFKGLTLYDAFSINSNILMAVLPLFIGRRFLASEDAHRVLLKVLVIAALIYSFFALYEIRMSPQLNRTFYGFFQHSFTQHIRAGGFRPVVFLPHGLILSLFFAMAVLAAVILFRTSSNAQTRLKWLLSAIWIFGVLFLSKSLGAFLLALVFAPVVLFLGRRLQLLSAAIVAAIAFSFPILRSNDVVPVYEFRDFVASIDPARANSFTTRLENEDRLLDRAMQRPLTGWGTYGRNRVFSSWGKDISLTDGYWILVIGQYGWLGYLAQFGLITMPILLLGLYRKRYEISLVSTGVVVVYAVNVIDLIPNASVTPIFWLLAGSVLGFYQTVPLKEKAAQPGYARAGKEPQPSGPVGDEPPTPSEPIVLHKRRPRTTG